MTVTLLEGHVIDVLASQPANHWHTCVTSPPYLWLRNYSTVPQVWEDGWVGELGQEPSPELYVEHLVAVFRAVKRVLRPDGTLWVNLAGCYFNDPSGQNGSTGGVGVKALVAAATLGRQKRGKHPWLKPLDWVDVPGLFAQAMQQPYAEHCIKREPDRTWLAALVDGEGTISIHKKEHKALRADGTPGETQYVPFLSISNTDPNLLQKCVDITGYGEVRVKNPIGEDTRGIRSRFVGYGWRLDADKAIEVIRDIFPHLITKRRQAILANTVDASNKENRALRWNGRVPADVRERRERLKTLANACNQREEGIVIPDWCKEPAPVTMHPGWTWRSDVVWVKPSALPESVSGTRWERCRVRLKGQEPRASGLGTINGYVDGGVSKSIERLEGAEWADCPGCPKCAANEGLVLRRGSGRPTKATERILLFTRGPGYYFDQEAVRETTAESTLQRLPYKAGGHKLAPERAGDGIDTRNRADFGNPEAGRNLRDWWVIGPEPLKDAHYAAYPSALPERCIKAGTSEWGCCPRCGAPWARVVERESAPVEVFTNRSAPDDGFVAGHRLGGVMRGAGQKLQEWRDEHPSKTLGWRPTCAPRCPGYDQPPVPCRTLDPFGGSGTTGLAANRLGRDCTLIELKSEYAELARKRVGREPLSLFAWQGQDDTPEEVPL